MTICSKMVEYWMCGKFENMRNTHYHRLLIISLILSIGGMLVSPSEGWAASPKDVKKAKKSKACKGCDLSGATFIKANLGRKNLTKANLKKADLSNATL